MDGTTKEEGTTTAVSADFVIDKLVRHPTSVGQEWTVNTVFTVDHLNKLVFCRVEEVFFTEKDSCLYVNDRETSTEAVNLAFNMSGRSYARLFERENHGHLNAHIHPVKFPQNVPSWLERNYNWLSWEDIRSIIDTFNPDTRYLLFHRDGGLEYSFPRKSPTNVDVSNKDIYYKIFSDYIFNTTGRRISFYGSRGKPDEVVVDRLPDEQQFAFAKKFTEMFGMVVQTSTWDDKDQMQKLIDIINNRGLSTSKESSGTEGR